MKDKYELGHNCQICGNQKNYTYNCSEVIIISPFCDECTKILIDIVQTRKKQIDDELSKRCIAVISRDGRDFEKWVFANKIESSNLMLVFYNKAYKENITYNGVCGINDLCSNSFDEVIETENAKDNPEYEQIIKAIKGNIKTNKI
jgi:hypothetical protein